MFINENHFNSPQYRTFLQALVKLSGFWCENLYLTNFPGEVLSPCVPQWLNVCSLTESSPANAFWTWRYDKSKQFNVLDLLILHKIFRSRRELWARVITRVNLPRTGIFHIIHFQCKGVLGVSFSASNTAIIGYCCRIQSTPCQERGFRIEEKKRRRIQKLKFHRRRRRRRI